LRRWLSQLRLAPDQEIAWLSIRKFDIDFIKTSFLGKLLIPLYYPVESNMPFEKPGPGAWLTMHINGIYFQFPIYIEADYFNFPIP